MSQQEEVTAISWTGEGDVTTWLQESNLEDPVIYPQWPSDYPNHVAIGLRWDEDFPDGPIELVLPSSRLIMLAARQPGRLWFCKLPLDEVVAHTTAEASWF
jgi:hypothetical protein